MGRLMAVLVGMSVAATMRRGVLLSQSSPSPFASIAIHLHGALTGFALACEREI
jgi:hypothetical protein